VDHHLKIDLHVHTCCSPDGLRSERLIIAAWKKKELSGVNITDHNTIKGAAAFKKIAPNNFLVIVGEEIQTKEVEIMSYFLK